MNDAWLGKLFVRFRERRDGKALAAVFDATARELLGVAAHLAPSLDQAEDVVQTTFVRAIEHAERYDASQSLKGWLYGILWREAAQLRRRESRREVATPVDQAVASDADSLASGRELDEAVKHALARVPPPYREVLEPVLSDGRSSREVAQRLGRSPGTVRVQLQRGLERLRRELAVLRAQPSLGAGRSGGFVGLPRMRAGILERAGFEHLAIPAASHAFLARQLVGVALAPLHLALGAALVVLAGFGAPRILGHAAERPQHTPPRTADSLDPTTPMAPPGSSAAPTRREPAPPARHTPAAGAPEPSRYGGVPGGTGSLRVELAPPLLELGAVQVRLEGVSAELSGYSRKLAAETSDGVTFEQLAAGRYRATVTNLGCIAQAVELAAGEAKVVLLRPGRLTLRGRITSAGEIVSGVEVSARELGGDARELARGTVSANGAYEVPGLESGAYELILAGARVLRQYRRVELRGRDAWLDVDLPAGRIEGRLVGVDFLPDRGDDELGFDRKHVRVFPLGWYQESGGRGLFLEPGADGSFTANCLPPGDYVVSVTRATCAVQARVVTLTEAALVQTLELGPVVEVGTLLVRVQAPPGTDLALACLRREPQGLRRVEYAEPDAAGAFHQELEPGAHALLVSDFAAHAPFTFVPSVEIRAGQVTELDLALPPSRQLQVRLDAGADPAAPRTWRLRVPSGEWLPYVLFVGSDSEGRHAPERAFRLPLGRYALEADFGDPVPLVREFEVVPGEGAQELVIARTSPPSGDAR